MIWITFLSVCETQFERNFAYFFGFLVEEINGWHFPAVFFRIWGVSWSPKTRYGVSNVLYSVAVLQAEMCSFSSTGGTTEQSVWLPLRVGPEKCTNSRANQHQSKCAKCQSWTIVSLSSFKGSSTCCDYFNLIVLYLSINKMEPEVQVTSTKDNYLFVNVFALTCLFRQIQLKTG